MNIPSLKLSEVAPAISAKVLRDGAFSNLGFSIHKSPNLLTWLENKKYLAGISQNPCISCVVASPDLAEAIPNNLGVLLHERPRDAFYLLHNHLARSTSFYGKPVETQIHPTASISPGSNIAHQSVIIEKNVIIEPGVTILAGTYIGAESIIRAGVVLGSQGLQFTRIGGRWVAVEHVGGVKIGEDVEIQSNSNVCRAIFRGDTVIGDNTKLDALVHVGHNVNRGKRGMICAGVIIGGSTIIGDDVYIGLSATILNCIEIGNGARITMGAVAVNSLADKAHVTGNWAVPHDKHLQGYMAALRCRTVRRNHNDRNG